MGWSPASVPLLWSFHHLVKSIAARPRRGALRPPLAGGRGVVRLVRLRAHLRWVRRSPAPGGRSSALFLVYALYHGLAEGAERAIIADLSDRGARGRAFGLYHGLVGAAALPAGIATGWLWDRWGAPWALGMNAACAALGSALLFGLTFAGPLRRSAARRPR